MPRRPSSKPDTPPDPDAKRRAIEQIMKEMEALQSPISKAAAEKIYLARRKEMGDVLDQTDEERER
jgi:hypothetical protein